MRVKDLKLCLGEIAKDWTCFNPGWHCPKGRHRQHPHDMYYVLPGHHSFIHYMLSNPWIRRSRTSTHIRIILSANTFP